VKSAAWYGATRVWAQGLSWVITILLARLLAPDDYGLFAMALSVLGLLELLQEFGLGTAIVQRQDLTRKQLNGVFWLVTLASVGLTLVTCLAAGLISDFYAEPRLVWIVRILSLNFLLNSLGLVPYNLLTKAMDLRQRSLAEALAAATGALLTLSLAWLSLGVWALVLGHFARALVLNTALVVFARWRPGIDVAWDGLRGLMNFGLRIAGMNIIGNLGPTISTFVLARLLGGTAVGLYAMAQSLTEAPHRISTAIINQVSFPVFSKLQRQTAELARYFLSISKYLAVVALPIQIGLILVAPDLVPVLLSAKWQDIVVPFQVFCIESILVVVTVTCTPLLTARGRADLLLRRSVFSLAAMTLATVVGAHFGLVGVTVARVLAMIPLRFTLLMPSLRELDLSMGEYFKNLTTPLSATCVMTLLVLVAQQALPASAGQLPRLIVSVGIGVVSYPSVLLLLDRSVGAEVKVIVRDLLSTSRG
jgi:O-antigen/teichoic acid export membrane protein